MDFIVTTVNCTKDENDILIVGFQNDQDYLIIQYSEEFDDQELVNSWSKYYLEINSLGGSYSCIDTIELSLENLVIKFNKNGINKFYIDLVNIEFLLTYVQWKELEIFLTKIFVDEKDVNFKIIKF